MASGWDGGKGSAGQCDLPDAHHVGDQVGKGVGALGLADGTGGFTEGASAELSPRG